MGKLKLAHIHFLPSGTGTPGDATNYAKISRYKRVPMSFFLPECSKSTHSACIVQAKRESS
jgi:hypothetical protein